MFFTSKGGPPQHFSLHSHLEGKGALVRRRNGERASVCELTH